MEEIQKYLASLAYDQRTAPSKTDGSGPHPFVTISRQAGVGGRTLAKAILEAMRRNHPGRPLFQNWQIFDRELCDTVAADPEIRVSMESLLSEKYRSQIEDYLCETIAQETPQYEVFKRIFQTIRGLAACGKAIIVGRAGSCVAKGLPGGVHIRLVASESDRVNRMKGLLQTGDRDVRKRMREMDASRARLVKVYFGKDINDPLLYDAIFNTTFLPIAQIAEVVLNMIEQKATLKAELQLR